MSKRPPQGPPVEKRRQSAVSGSADAEGSAGCSNLYPVILAVTRPEPDMRGSNQRAPELRGRKWVRHLSSQARVALGMSARRTGTRLEILRKDDRGAPLPSGGWHWSVTHKRRYVAGVVSPAAVGIDLERIKPCSQAMFRKVADPGEWELVNDDPLTGFFRFWTAKEAVLKAGGVGLSQLSRCRVIAIADRNNLWVTHDRRRWAVNHFYFDGHIASIAGNGIPAIWHRVTAD